MTRLEAVTLAVLVASSSARLRGLRVWDAAARNIYALCLEALSPEVVAEANPT